MPSIEFPEQPTFKFDEERTVSMGDRVIVVRLYRDDDEVAQLGITDESMAVFAGCHVVECDGEVLFDGKPIPLIEVELGNGQKEKVFGFECDWMLPEDHTSAWDELREDIPDFPPQP